MKGKSSATMGTTEASGERELLSTNGRRFFFFFSSVFPLLFLFILRLLVYKNKQSRNITLRKACKNSFYVLVVGWMVSFEEI
jgi:uncharacterized membrane protein YGL010W